MLDSIRTDPLWPAFVANIEALTDAQLAALSRTDAGRLQLGCVRGGCVG
jgi:hypothetical protein